jgi:major membrane immunogen (membrane-anchored lipoprotein)
MKRIIAMLVLMVAVCFIVAGCGSTNASAPAPVVNVNQPVSESSNGAPSLEEVAGTYVAKDGSVITIKNDGTYELTMKSQKDSNGNPVKDWYDTGKIEISPGRLITIVMDSQKHGKKVNSFTWYGDYVKDNFEYQYDKQ